MDNQGAMSITKDSKYHTRTKHIDIYYYFIQDLVKEETIISRYVRSKENVTDILIKALSKEIYKAGMARMGLRVLESRT